MSQGSAVAGEIAKDISEVNYASTKIFDHSTQVDKNATNTSEIAQRLKELVKQFILD